MRWLRHVDVGGERPLEGAREVADVMLNGGKTLRRFKSKEKKVEGRGDRSILLAEVGLAAFLYTMVERPRGTRGGNPTGDCNLIIHSKLKNEAVFIV